MKRLFLFFMAMIAFLPAFAQQPTANARAQDYLHSRGTSV